MEEKDKKIIENAQIASIKALNTVKDIDNILTCYNKSVKRQEVEDKLLIRYINLLKTREVTEKPELEAKPNMFLVYLIILCIGILIYYDNINSNVEIIEEEIGEKVNKIEIFKIIINKIVNIKYILMGALGHKIMEVIIFQLKHINRLENIINILL